MTKSTLSICFSILFLIIFASMAWASAGYNELAKYYPLFISILGVILALVNTIQEIFAYRKAKSKADEGRDENIQDEEIWDIPISHSFIDAGKNFLWVVFYFVLIMIIGFLPATTIFLLVFLKKRTDFNWFKTLLSIGITIGVLLMLESVMYIKWPIGMF